VSTCNAIGSLVTHFDPQGELRSKAPGRRIPFAPESDTRPPLVPAEDLGRLTPMSRQFQFSLTWLAIAALVFAAFFGGVATGRRCYEIENERQSQEIRASFERTRQLEELVARRQAIPDP
jgi:hypothetical protein